MSSPPATSQSKRRTLAVELPECVVQLVGSTSEDAARHLAELALVDLFRQGQVSSGWAARQLEISKDACIALLAKHDVPYIGMSEDEFLQQLQEAAPIRQLPLS